MLKPFLKMTAQLIPLLAFNSAIVFAGASETKTEKVIGGYYVQSMFESGDKIRAVFASTNNVYLSGSEIDFSATTTENAFLLAGEIQIRDAKARSLFAAGRTITADNAELKDATFAAQDIQILNSTIASDAILAGGTIEIGADSVVNGDARIYGRDVKVDGDVVGSMAISATNVVLNGVYDGDLAVRADRLTIGDGVVIRGNLAHTTRELKMGRNAKVLGKITAAEAPSSPSALAYVFLGFLFFIGALATPAIVVLFTPVAIRTRFESFESDFWSRLGKGFLTVVLAPAGVVLLLFSAVGTPLALFLVPVILAGAAFAWVMTAYLAGNEMRLRFTKARSGFIPNRSTEFWWTILGAATLFILMMIPVLGALVVGILYCASVGSFYVRSPQKIESRATPSGFPAHA